MRIVFDELTKEQAETFGLVLLSADIEYKIEMNDNGWVLWVHEHAFDEAFRVVTAYQQENIGFKPERYTSFAAYGKTWSGLWGVLVILSFYLAVSSGHDAGAFRQAYGSSASHILDGEWYRSVTSLLLHANALHLLGNMVGLALFGTGVCSVTGWGVGWVLILTSGILGNVINAFLYKSGHVSIGASTAIFGALGVLSSYQFLRKMKESGTWFQALLPVAAGLALLGFLGASKNTDITAHLFGFSAGIFLGLLYSWLIKRPLQWSYQLGALLIVIAVIAGAWIGPFKTI